MAINKVLLAALKALSFPDLNIKKNYKFARQMELLSHYHVLKPFYRTWDHKIIRDGHPIPVRIFSPEEEGPHPVLLFFHGGGWVTGNIDSYNKVCVNMANLTRHTVVSVDYRLAPEYRFPIAPEDCYHVAREIFLNNTLLPARTEDITLIGDSAGGNLAAAVSLMARDRGEFLPARQILIYPATHFDHGETSPFPSVHENGTDYLLTSKRICDYLELYRGSEEDDKNPYFAPLSATDFSHQPRTLIITAQYDPLRDEGEAYGHSLREAGNEVEIHRLPDTLHGFFSLSPTYPQVKECYDIISRFLVTVLKRYEGR